MTEAEATAICSDEHPERECIDFLASSVGNARKMGPGHVVHKKRKRMPQRVVEKAIVEAGVWSFDELELAKSQ